MALWRQSSPGTAAPEAASVLELVAAARAGSSAAFGGLVARYQAPLYAFLVQRARSPEDAEELCQEAFLRAWQRLALYDSRWQFATWLFTVARRLAASRYRRPRREESAPGESEQVAPPRAEPAAVAQAGEESRNLWLLARHNLTPDQHLALWLRYAEDCTPEAIGKILGKSAANVRVILFRARERLGQVLREIEQRQEPNQLEPQPSKPWAPAEQGAV